MKPGEDRGSFHPMLRAWESPETFEAFGATLMPILGELGVDPGEPAIMPIHRLTQTSASQT